ncbi:hypothetical protein AQJ11_39940 [Streptomyces corchorusii]|uniref:Uncharacterized protein n=2 Tax=Streptomyces TaxID=1883 RepID=A0A117Q9M4_STRCK|nr:hypothetical protein [Streptomyces corchorusii]KUN16271.1 hypothetical protein AQJ11_39940 [Streptomyces corchorusii]
MTYTARDQWEQHFSDGKGFRQVGERERELLAEHTPAPDGGGRALGVGYRSPHIGGRWALPTIREVMLGNHRFRQIAGNTGAPLGPPGGPAVNP